MVEVPDRRPATRGAADPAVTGQQETAQRPVEDASLRVHRRQRAVLGMGVEPAEPHLRRRCDVRRRVRLSVRHRRRSAGRGRSQQPSRPLGGHRAVAGQAGRSGVTREQGAVGDHQLHLDRHRIGDRLAGDSLDQRVGHHLTAPARVTGDPRRVRGPRQRRQHPDALRRREERGEPAHRVRRRPQRHPAFRLGVGRPVHHSLRVQPVRDRPHPTRQLPLAQASQLLADALRQFGVHAGPLLHRQGRALADDQGRAALGQQTTLQQPEQERHLVRQRVGQLHETAPGVRRLTSRQRDLGGDPDVRSHRAVADPDERRPRVGASRRPPPGRRPLAPSPVLCATSRSRPRRPPPERARATAPRSVAATRRGRR